MPIIIDNSFYEMTYKEQEKMLVKKLQNLIHNEEEIKKLLGNLRGSKYAIRKENTDN